LSFSALSTFGVLGEERIYTAQEVAKILDCDLGHVYDLIRSRRLRASNISTGKCPVWRIRESSIRTFFAANENDQPEVPSVPQKVKVPKKTAKLVDTLRDKAAGHIGSFAEAYAARKAGH
jgi:excisionase family DNA binding protein